MSHVNNGCVSLCQILFCYYLHYSSRRLDHPNYLIVVLCHVFVVNISDHLHLFAHATSLKSYSSHQTQNTIVVQKSKQRKTYCRSCSG